MARPKLSLVLPEGREMGSESRLAPNGRLRGRRREMADSLEYSGVSTFSSVWAVREAHHGEADLLGDHVARRLRSG